MKRRALACLSIALATLRCIDSTAPHPLENSIGVIVSGLVVPPAGTAGGPAHSSAILTTGVAYVSLPPSSVPQGLAATITNHSTGFAISTAVVHGGFDPVAIGANVDDTLGVDITTTPPGAAATAVLVVAARRPPKIVRTNPPRGGRDVPLNSTILVVFSGPIDPGSLPSGIALLEGDTTHVAGSVGFADSAQIRATLQPTEPLAPLATYNLVVSQAIQDVNGLALDSAAVVTFTTGASGSVTGLVFASVSAGAGYTCGVTPAGAAYCWGYNAEGQLGDGTTTTQLSPVAVGDAYSFAAVRTARNHTCALTSAGAAYCWGYNGSGALGDETTTDRTSPVAVGGGLTFAVVSPALRHTCGVTPANAAYCWGLNAEGQLGIGTATGPELCQSFACSPTAVAVGGGLSFTNVSAGYTHTCGLATAGAVYCWGANGYGQLGDGTTTDRTSPVAVAGGLTFAAVSAGVYHTCGVTTAGAAYCWGANGLGGLGDGTTTDQSSPVAVAGGLSFAAVSAGDFHTCGLTPAGAAYCWGDNRFGGLGDGTTTDQSSPVAVAGGLTFAAVSAGGYHNCGVTPAGVLYCWGSNASGELGNGTTTNSAVPVKVAGQP